jgi:hypothetical protein
MQAKHNAVKEQSAYLCGFSSNKSNKKYTDEK